LLANHFGGIDALLDASVEEFVSVPGIGDVVAASIHQYFHDRRSRKLIDTLRKRGVKMAASAPPRREGPLAGQTFVVTGTLSAFSRPEAEERIRSLGGQAASSVTKATDYLVVGESPGSKVEKARKYGTPLLTDEEFLALLQKHGAA
jgi:DNA ligase (NAD+)